MERFDFGKIIAYFKWHYSNPDPDTYSDSHTNTYANPYTYSNTNTNSHPYACFNQILNQRQSTSFFRTTQCPPNRQWNFSRHSSHRSSGHRHRRPDKRRWLYLVENQLGFRSSKLFSGR